MGVDTFWSGRHALSPTLEDLQRRLVPLEGPTAYVETELLRASNRIGYDYFNNGFGNDVSQAVAYIDHYHVPYATQEFIAAWTSVREMALWGAPIQSCDEIDAQITLVAVEIVERLEAADRLGLLSPLRREMYDMPSTEPGYDPELHLA
jgi:hypothetical protein